MIDCPQKPLMRYFGGKWRLAPWIISHLPPHRIYVEPYGGAASVLLRKEPSFSEVYNDIDGEVVNLFRTLQQPVLFNELALKLMFTPFSRDEFLMAFEPCQDQVERARRLLIRSWMGYGANGHSRRTGFRTNVIQQQRSVPAGDWKRLVDHWPVLVERLRTVCIENREAIDVILGHDSDGTLFYMDPPYSHTTRRGARYTHEMTDDQHRELACCANQVRGMVVISGYACPLYDELFSDWYRVTRSALADAGRKREEVLWLNPVAERALNAANVHPTQIEMFP